MTERTFTFSVSNLTALDIFAATVAPGAIVEFPAPSMAQRAVPSAGIVTLPGSFPFEPTDDAVADGVGDQLLDWATMMDYDTTTRRYYVSGGRPSTASAVSNRVLKMVVYDELANQWSSIDRWSPTSHAGHLYRSTTVLTQHQLVAYFPNNYDNSVYTGNSIELWDIVANAYWGKIPGPPANIAGANATFGGNQCICWFPTMGTQGGLVCVTTSSSRVVWFDWADRASGVLAWKTMTPQNFDPEWTGSSKQHMNGHYHPVMDKMLVGNSNAVAGAPVASKLAIINPDRTMALTQFTCPVSFGSGSPEGGPCLPHPTLPLSIHFDRVTNRIWTYDWRLEGTGVQPWQDRMATPTEIASIYTIGLAHPSGGGFLFAKYGAAGTTKTYYWKPPLDWS